MNTRRISALFVASVCSFSALMSCGGASTEDVEEFRLVASKAKSMQTESLAAILRSAPCESVRFGDWIDLNLITRRISDGLEADSRAGEFASAPMPVYLGTLDLSYSTVVQALYAKHLRIPEGHVSRERVYESVIEHIEDTQRLVLLYKELPEGDREALFRHLEYLSSGAWSFESSTTAMVTTSQLSDSDPPIYRFQIAFRPDFARLNLVIRGGDVDTIASLIAHSLCDGAPGAE